MIVAVNDDLTHTRARAHTHTPCQGISEIAQTQVPVVIVAVNDDPIIHSDKVTTLPLSDLPLR